MLKILLTCFVFFSFNNLFASCVDHWVPECEVYYGTDKHYHIWDGNHDYRIEAMIHDLNVCECVKPPIHHSH